MTTDGRLHRVVAKINSSRRGDDQQIAARPVPAAQYVRMSTDHQQYSTGNQADAIAAYATDRGFEIVATYADEGRSGVSLTGRAALRRLIGDVQSGAAFRAILVYDVSRWGRFQDVDESAYYEYICRRAGISVHYCAEQFDNDGSLATMIIKNMKRAMAGEFSRELSIKVFDGQCRMIERGFKAGGRAGYGLRRQLIDMDGTPKALLKNGERKGIQGDRVVLVPGPPEETETVRRIFRMFVEDRMDERDICRVLNGEGLRTDLERPFDRDHIRAILRGEKYIGNNVYGRVSRRLKTPTSNNPPDRWVRLEGAFEAIVDEAQFAAAQAIFSGRGDRRCKERLLDDLRFLLARHGSLSTSLIERSPATVSLSTYRQRFGTLQNAYRLIGYVRKYDYEAIAARPTMRSAQLAIISNIIATIERMGGEARRKVNRMMIVVNEELTIAVLASRCKTAPSGRRHWIQRLPRETRFDLALIARMDESGTDAIDYYLLPGSELGEQGSVQLRERNGAARDAYRSDDLEPLYRLARRHKLKVSE
jgi:DNA invertase Pin-like site-specific DNA recombinase